MSLKIDFHIHTWYSDGTMSPEEIVEKYAGEEFSTIAITDHEVTDGIREAQEAAKGKGIKALQQQNIDIKEEDLIQRPGQTYIGKPNFARALAAKGYIDEASQAFTPGQFLESDEVRAVEKEKLSTAEAIKLIRDAGGIAVLAHPCKIKGIGQRESEEFRRNFGMLLAGLKKAGLKGLECIYPTHSDEERLYFISMASKYHLHVTEGSDFHGR